MKYSRYYIVFLSLICFSCGQVIFGDDLESSNAQENFDYLWTECLERYTFFDLKGIDWEEVRVRYQAQITEGMDRVELFTFTEFFEYLQVVDLKSIQTLPLAKK